MRALALTLLALAVPASASAATIAGTVRDAQGGAQPGICVRSLPGVTDGGFVRTAADGSYKLGPLPAGGYKIEYDPCGGGNFLPVYTGGARDEASAAQIPVGETEDRTGVDATLPTGGAITGRVTDRADGAPVPDACVDAVGSPRLRNGRTAADGTYRIEGLATGSYQVAFTPFRNSTDVIIGGQCYARTNWFAAPFSTPVSVTEGSVTSGIDGQLARAGSISGRVTDTQGRPLANRCVDISPRIIPPETLGRTDSQGRYTFPQLPAGTYVVKLGGYLPTRAIAACETSGYEPRTMLDIKVADRQAVTGIDAKLSGGGKALARLSLSARRVSERDGRVRFDVTGKVLTFVQPGDCRTGVITFTTRRRGRTGVIVSTRKITVKRKNCSFSLRVAVARTRLKGWEGRLLLSGRYAGTRTVAASKTKIVRVKAPA